MSRQFKIIVILFFCFCFTFSTFGQKSDSTRNKIYLWLSAGISPWTFPDKSNPMYCERYAINSSINQKYYITLLYQKNNTYHWDYLFHYYPSPNEIYYIHNFSALFGIGKYKFKSLAFIASSGISFGELSYKENITDSTQSSSWPYTYYYDYEYDNFNYFGLPLNLKILLTSPIVGLSLDLYANIHKHTDYGIILNLNLGKIRDRKK